MRGVGTPESLQLFWWVSMFYSILGTCDATGGPLAYARAVVSLCAPVCSLGSMPPRVVGRSRASCLTQMALGNVEASCPGTSA